MNDSLDIKVSAKDVYDSLKRVEMKQDEMIKHQKHTNGNVTKNEQDIRKLQKFKTKAMTIWGIVVAGATIGGNYIINHLT